MEIPPDEDELEKILSSDEKEEIEEVPVEDEKNDDLSAESDDKIDFSTLKVAELKDLLKEKNLPVSGTKAELIERLKT